MPGPIALLVAAFALVFVLRRILSFWKACRAVQYVNSLSANAVQGSPVYKTHRWTQNGVLAQWTLWPITPVWDTRCDSWKHVFLTGKT